MRVLVNGLSIGSLSGQHVVYGFLRPLTRWTRAQHEYVLLTYESESPPAGVVGENVRWNRVPDRLRPWWRRTEWEWRELPRLVRRERIDLVLTTSGAVTPTCGVPQVSLAQNPWCFIRAAHSGSGESLKAALQRMAYRRALRSAAMMIYISRYLRDLYARLGSSGLASRSEIAYPAVDDRTHDAAKAWANRGERQPLLIVSVSVMAPWKGVETVVDAVRRVRCRGLDARLRLIGSWADAGYRARIEEQVASSGLAGAVEITGHVSREALHRHYAEARVFCLMSCCESYGIPAAEAQVFGTPVVAARDCAIPEVCDGAGLFGPSGDPEWTADALELMLGDDVRWQRYSRRAVANARSLRWEQCARPLLNIFSAV